MAMDKAIKSEWLKALRSKMYPQGAGKLYRGGAYCCLGVLAKIQGAELLSDNYDVFLDGVAMEKPAKGYLPDDLLAGLTVEDQYLLAGMNDGREDFETIADHIEKHL